MAETAEELDKLKFEEALIDFVREKKYLYDKADPDYKLKDVQENTWIICGEQLNKTGT